MARIRQLSSSVINKIAAGEVIERPGSVVKELVENSLDAGATRIEVALEQGGVDLVRVVDNGGGIAAEDLPLAIASHATSKLVTADDLFRVQTLGFRGEALASIAEISRFTIRSRQGAETAGVELSVVGGVAGEVAPCGCPPGTTIEVRDLFFNTPVRRKFLRSTQTEVGHVAEAFTRLALAHPQVHFTLRHNSRVVHDLPPSDDWRDRIRLFFGTELADGLIWIESEDPPIRLAGFVAHPSQSRPHARMQYLFLNGRHIRDRSLQHALGEAYRGLMLHGRYPISFLCFDMPSEMVDVNVHPTKMEVRFQDGGRLYSQLLGTIRTKFLSTDLTHVLDPERAAAHAQSSHIASGMPPAHAAGLGSNRPAPSPTGVEDLAAWAKGELQARVTGGATPPPHADFVPFPDGNPATPSTGASLFANVGQSARATWQTPPAAAPLSLQPLNRTWQPIGIEEQGPDETEFSGGAEFAQSPSLAAALDRLLPEDPSPDEASRGTTSFAGRPSAAVQIHNRYLVTESAEGVLVIDQHALHERILYEQFRAKALAGALETQHLLVPEPLDFAPAEAAAVLANAELLARLGIKVEPFGGGTVLVSSYPAMLTGVSPSQLLHDLVELLLNESRTPERRDLLDELLHMMSCKAAVKAGDRLTPEEIDALLAQRHLAQDTHHCPHGRPTALVFTREDLDRQFKRT
jgi:DNA mismatch repair protein MutL